MLGRLHAFETCGGHVGRFRALKQVGDFLGHYMPLRCVEVMLVIFVLWNRPESMGQIWFFKT